MAHLEGSTTIHRAAAHIITDLSTVYSWKWPPNSSAFDRQLQLIAMEFSSSRCLSVPAACQSPWNSQSLPLCPWILSFKCCLGRKEREKNKKWSKPTNKQKRIFWRSAHPPPQLLPPDFGGLCTLSTLRLQITSIRRRWSVNGKSVLFGPDDKGSRNIPDGDNLTVQSVLNLCKILMYNTAGATHNI